jgi:hypothetical protein
VTKKQRAEYDRILKTCTPEVEKLAAEAVKKESWMVPTQDAINLPYADYEQSEIDGWRQTDQYGIRWRYRIAEAVVRELDAGDILTGEGRMRISLIGELEDVFWDAWAAGHKLYKFWQKHNKKARKSA